MKPEELFEFVVSRAQSALAGGCEILSRHELEKINPVLIRASKIRQKYWAKRSSGRCTIGDDCVTLNDSDGQPIRLKSRSDLEDYGKLLKSFRTKRYQSLWQNRVWENQVFRDNRKHLRVEYGGGVQQSASLAKAAGLPPGSTVYAVPLINLIYYIQHSSGQEAKVIFLSLLRW